MPIPPNDFEMKKIKLQAPGVYVFADFCPGVIAGFSGRQFERVRFGRFLEKLGADERRFVSVKQEHTTEILIAEEPVAEERIVADGIITNRAGLACGVRTADCVPIFYFDPREKVAGIAHAGWRGIRDGICGKMVERMKETFGTQPANVRVAIGPAIRDCCYEVGEEFREYFPEQYRIRKTGPSAGKGFVDLAAAAAGDLIRAGVGEPHIRDCGICTSCRHDLFFSARRGDGKERILSVIQMAAETRN